MPNRSQRRADEKLPQLIDDSTTAYELAQRLKRGESIRDAANNVGIALDYARQLISSAMTELAWDNQHALSAWVALSISRTEDIIRGSYPHMFEGDGKPNEAAIRIVLDTIGRQEKILAMFKLKEREDGDATETVSTTSPLIDMTEQVRRGRPDELDGIIVGGVTYAAPVYQQASEDTHRRDDLD